MAVLEEDVALHLGEELTETQRPVGTSERRSGAMHDAADEQQHEGGTRGEDGETMGPHLEFGLERRHPAGRKRTTVQRAGDVNVEVKATIPRVFTAWAKLRQAFF